MSNKYITICGQKYTYTCIDNPNIILSKEQRKVKKKLIECMIKKAGEKNMRTSQEIFEDVMKNIEILDSYSEIIEICCFKSLQILLRQYKNNHISKDLATKEKQRIFRVYEQNKKQYEFYLSIYFEKYKAKISKEKEELHNKLQEKMKTKNASIEECFLLALELLEMYEERFK